MANQAPVVASTNIICPGGLTAKGPVVILATHPLAVATAAALEYQPSTPAANGQATLELSTANAMRAFGRRLSASQLPADLGFSRSINPLNIGLSGPAWTRVLDEYIAAGLLAYDLSELSKIDVALAALVILNPAALVIGAQDWRMGETLVFSPGIPAVLPVLAQPARLAVAARRGRAAVPAVPAIAAVPGQAAVPGTPPWMLTYSSYR